MGAEQSAASPPAGAISLIERASHLPTALLMLSFVLALDVGASLSSKSTLLSLTWGGVQEHITMGNVLLLILVFSLSMSVGVKVLKYFADMLVLIALRPSVSRWFHHDDVKPPYRGAVRPYTLRETAHLEQNNFYLGLYNEYELIQSESRDQEYQLAVLAFACIMLGVVNCLILPWNGYPTLSHQLAVDFPNVWNVFITLFSIFLLGIWLYPLLRDKRADDWVYCLALYQKLEEEKIQNMNPLSIPVPRRNQAG